MPQIDIHIILVSLILLASLLLFASGKISVDKTAIGTLIVLALTKILTPRETVSGFANPAVLTVGPCFFYAMA